MTIFNNDENKLLKEILTAIQQSNAQAVDNNALLRLQAAELIAANQRLQIIVDNTNPPVFPTSFTVKQTN